jgi:hypothetical protein
LQPPNPERFTSVKMRLIGTSNVWTGFAPPAPVISLRYQTPYSAGSWREGVGEGVTAGRVVAGGCVVAGGAVGWLRHPAAMTARTAQEKRQIVRDLMKSHIPTT